MTWREELHPRAGDGEFAHKSMATWAHRVASAMPPVSLTKGYRRVGDHPRGVGKVGGEDADLWTPSSHPLAGGLWIDPARPGTRHEPRYLNDAGVRVAGVTPPKHRTQLRQESLKAKRREGAYGSPEELDHREARRRGQVVGARLGYSDDTPEAFVAHMKRMQPRARQEQPKAKVRRTPRGTRVSGWMDEAGARIARTRG